MLGTRSARIVALIGAIAAVAAMAVAGTASGGSQAAGGAACAKLPFAPPKNQQGNILNRLRLPADLREGYNNYLAPLMPSPYASFRAKQPPYTVAYSESFSGNAWRASARKALERNFAAAKQQ